MMKTAAGPILMLLLCLGAFPAAAQNVPGCSVTALSDPPRQALDCGNGLVMEIEGAGELLREDASDEANRFRTRDGAVLIEIVPGATPFQIRTPHAIASVRGTKFIVDATPASTSVLTLEGSVSVAPLEGGGAVLLGPGDGVDVVPGRPLQVVAWGQQRVADLLARFAR